jgi:2-oxo-3-hexenedioate decarboxylase
LIGHVLSLKNYLCTTRTTIMNIFNLAATLDQAAVERKAVEQITNQTSIDIEQAYIIQSLSLMHRYKRGELFTGLKLGFTSYAKMQQMGITDMIWGRLTSAMNITEHGYLDHSKFIHPRAEAEIAFRVSKKIDRLLTLDNCKDFADGIAIAIEIIDSRYQNFKFTLPDVIADNCSSASYVIGNWHDVNRDISQCKMTLSLDGEIKEEGSSADILGNPWASFCAASRLALQYHETIDKGHIILAGAATPAVHIKGFTKAVAYAEGLGEATINIHN